MKSVLSLNGSWRLAGLEDSKTVDANVPGIVAADLHRAGLAEDPFSASHAPELAWIHERQWSYERVFEVAEGFRQKRTFLVFDSLMGSAAVCLNGEEIGRVEGEGLNCRFDVTDRLVVGANTVAVSFDPRTRPPADQPGCPPAFVGISRDVCVVSFDRVAVADIRVDPEIEGGWANAWISVEIENFAGEDQDVVASIVVARGEAREKIEVVDVVSPFGGVFEAVIRIEEPELWWPNGFGEQAAYRCLVGLQVDGEVQDAAEQYFGVRTVEIRDSPSLALVVNGEEVFCKAGDWLPADSLDVRADKTHLRRLVKLAREANFNMLRVKNCERPEFYRVCDEMGIMLWQEIECATAQAAAALVKQLRSHPSVVVWSGRREDLIVNVLRSLDHSRPYWPGLFGGKIELSGGQVMDASGSAEQFPAAVAQGQTLQAEIEECRRQKGAVPGVLLASFNDCRPAGIIDRSLAPRIVYFYVKRAFTPVIVSFKRIEDRVQAHVTSDNRAESIEGRLRVGVLSFETCGVEFDSTAVKLPPNASRAFWESGPLDAILPDPARQCLVALLEVRGEIVARNFYFARDPAEMDFPMPKLLVEREQISEKRHRMVIAANGFARNLAILDLPRGAVPSDNYFDLLPGERYEVTISNVTQEQAKSIRLDLLRR